MRSPFISNTPRPAPVPSTPPPVTSVAVYGVYNTDRFTETDNQAFPDDNPAQWAEALPMRASLKGVILLLLLFFARGVSAQENFRFPAKFDGIPVDYLERMKVSDTSRRLTEKEKHDLARLFAKAYVLSVRIHLQDYILNTRTPIYQLVAANFPDVKSREGEGGAIIFLGSITRYFNSLPEYRDDVLRVLREGMDGRHCR